MDNMTILSTEMFNRAIDTDLSIKAAVSLLKEQAVFRTLKDKLLKFGKGRDIKNLIIEGLVANDSTRVRDSVQRKVRGWFNDDERNIRKQDAMELCFILDLSLEEADLFLAMVAEEGIHWRNPEEIVFAFALKNKLSYTEAQNIYKEISAEIHQLDENENVYTSLVKKEIMEITSINDLKAYIKQAKSKLGVYHNTAFSLFMEYMNVLENPPTNVDLPKEKTMSATEISESYLNGKIIPRFKKNSKNNKDSFSSLSAVERNLRLNWPDEYTISRIKNREIDVSRKILILLFLVTDGVENYFEDDYEDYCEMDDEDVFKETYLRLSTMLRDCGFAQLDPRVPFDWMILYCICVSDTWEIDDKMKNFLNEAFNNGKTIQE